MDEVDFDDLEALEAWFEKRSQQERDLQTSRAALRVLANISLVPDALTEELALPLFWATLISSVGGSGRTDGMAAEGAFHFAQAASESAAPSSAAAAAASLAAFSAVYSNASMAAYSAAQSAEAAALSLPDSGAYSNFSSPQSTVRSAILDDAKHIDLEKPLWPGGVAPEAIVKNHQSLLAFLSERDDYSFFCDWYAQMWEGTWTDWDLAHEVAKIETEVWEDGIGAVAAEIEWIKDRRGRDLPRPENVPPLEQKKLLQHVRQLLKSSDITALNAEGAAETLERAINQFLSEAPANCLPDELAHLHDLPPLFRAISATVKSQALGDARERRLAEQIEALNAKVAGLEAQLKGARRKSVSGVFTESALKAAGSAFGGGTMATLGLATGYFFGYVVDNSTLENFRGWLSLLEGAEPRPVEVPELPPVTDV